MTSKLTARLDRLEPPAKRGRLRFVLVVDYPYTEESVAQAKRELEARGERLTECYVLMPRPAATVEEWLERIAPRVLQ